MLIRTGKGRREVNVFLTFKQERGRAHGGYAVEGQVSVVTAAAAATEIVVTLPGLACRRTGSRSGLFPPHACVCLAK